MPAQEKIKIGVIGASGYTGADLIRLAACHPLIEIGALAANTHAGKALGDVFPHLGFLGAPPLVKAEEADWGACDAVFCGLPHGTAQDIIATLPESVKVIDMSADFRLRDTGTYAKWYGREHAAAHLLQDAVYGLTEFYGEAIAKARLVACPGCYPTAALLALLPLVHAKLIDATDIVIDAKSGISGAGRSLKQNILFSEAGEGLSPYAIASHRHAPEIEQEISAAVGEQVLVSFARNRRRDGHAERADIQRIWLARRGADCAGATGHRAGRVERQQRAGGRRYSRRPARHCLGRKAG